MKAKRWLFRTGIALFWILVWQVGSMIMNKQLLLPSPYDTIQTLLALAGKSAFWKSTGTTLLRITAGFLTAAFLGTILGIVNASLPILGAFLAPLFNLIKSTPVSSFIILVLLWLPVGVTPAFISFLMVLPIFWSNVSEGISSIDKNLLEMSAMYSFGIKKTVRYVYIPSVMPFFSAACTTGFGFAWKAGISAEVIAKPMFSIGKNLQDAKIYLETSDLFAWTLLVILLSVLLEKVVRIFIGRIQMTEGIRKK